MKDKYLTERERYQIEILRRKKVPVSEIAVLLGRAESTVWRELKLGTVEQIESKTYKTVYVYLADVGQRIQEERSHRKGAKLKYMDTDLRVQIGKLLNKKYSPYAVHMLLPSSGKAAPKTIYNYIHKGLVPGFRPHDMLCPRHKRQAKEVDKRIARNHAGYTSIEERPLDVLGRRSFGHWELDTVESGKGDKTSILAFSERKHRLELLFKVSGKTAGNTVRILDRLERKLTAPVFRQVFKSITVDNGCEFLDVHGMERSKINKCLQRTKVYYCHPYCASERGTNENQNRFVRRFIPKGDHISLYTQREVRGIQDFMNHYPRRMLGRRPAIDGLAELDPWIREKLLLIL